MNNPVGNLQIYTIDRKNNTAVLVDRFTGEVTFLPLTPATYLLLTHLDIYSPEETPST